MAFMMPVVKNDWDVYHKKTTRSRRSSECSSAASNSNRALRARSRGTSECRSEGPSLSTSPATHDLLIVGSPHRWAQIQNNLGGGNHGRLSRTSSSSRNSQASLQSPQKDEATSSPPSSGSQSSLNKFHHRLVDKLRRSLGSLKSDKAEKNDEEKRMRKDSGGST